MICSFTTRFFICLLLSMTYVALVSLVTSFSAHKALQLCHFLLYLVATFVDAILLLAIPLILVCRTFFRCFPSFLEGQILFFLCLSLFLYSTQDGGNFSNKTFVCRISHMFIPSLSTSTVTFSVRPGKIRNFQKMAK